MTEEQENINKAWEMMSSLRTCMLVTYGDASLQGRPMSAIVEAEDQAVYFITNKTSKVVKEIEENSEIYLGFSDASSKYLSVNGQATTSNDEVLLKRLWSPWAQAFFPEGPESGDAIVILVRPTSAEFWDGPPRAVSVFKMAFAAMTGKPPDLGKNEKIDALSAKV